MDSLALRVEVWVVSGLGLSGLKPANCGTFLGRAVADEDLGRLTS